jgi:hypothetical protein
MGTVGARETDRNAPFAMAGPQQPDEFRHPEAGVADFRATWRNRVL